MSFQVRSVKEMEALTEEGKIAYAMKKGAAKAADKAELERLKSGKFTHVAKAKKEEGKKSFGARKDKGKDGAAEDEAADGGGGGGAAAEEAETTDAAGAEAAPAADGGGAAAGGGAGADDGDIILTEDDYERVIGRYYIYAHWSTALAQPHVYMQCTC